VTIGRFWNAVLLILSLRKSFTAASYGISKCAEERRCRLLLHLARATAYLNMHIVVPCGTRSPTPLVFGTMRRQVYCVSAKRGKSNRCRRRAIMLLDSLCCLLNLYSCPASKHLSIAFNVLLLHYFSRPLSNPNGVLLPLLCHGLPLSLHTLMVSFLSTIPFPTAKAPLLARWYWSR
jgi:hypothetical protein